MKRQHSLELGDNAVIHMSEVVNRRPDRWYHDVEIMHTGVRRRCVDGFVLSAFDHAVAPRTRSCSIQARWLLVGSATEQRHEHSRREKSRHADYHEGR